MKIYSPHFYNNSPLRIYLAGEQMLKKPTEVKQSPPAYTLSLSLVTRIKKIEKT
jgi:hypothetical protein